MKNVLVKMEMTLTQRDLSPRKRQLCFNGPVKDFYKELKDLLDEILIVEDNGVVEDLFNYYRSIFDEAVIEYKHTVDNLPHDDLIDVSNFLSYFYKLFMDAYCKVRNSFNDYYTKLGSGGEDELH